MTRRAFTLIELLVVIAVVATLTGLLAPSLAGARAAARASACLSNLHQLSVALESYATDARGAYAAGAADFLKNLQRWHGARTSASQPFSPAGGSLSEYLGVSSSSSTLATGTVRECPAFTSRLVQLAALKQGFERGCGGYGYNNAYVGTRRGRTAPGIDTVITDRTGQLQARFASPARTIAFGDAAIAALADGPAEYSFVEPPRWASDPDQQSDPSMHFRHGGRSADGSSTANVVWLDGHASTERRTYTWSSGVYPADPAQHQIGWFGAADATTTNSLFDMY